MDNKKGELNKILWLQVIIATIFTVLLFTVYFFLNSEQNLEIIFKQLLLDIIPSSLVVLIGFIILYFVFLRKGIDTIYDKNSNFIDESIDQRIQSSVNKTLQKSAQIDNIDIYKMNNFNKWGLARIHDCLPESKVNDLFKKAKAIKILETWLSTPGFYDEAFRIALQKGCTIQILILEKQSDFAKRRSELIDNPVAEVFDASIAAWRKNKTILKFHKNGYFDVRQYNKAFPPIQLYGCDTNYFIGFYSIDTNSINGPHLEVNPNETLFGKFVNEEFNKIWEVAEKIELENNTTL